MEVFFFVCVGMFFGGNWDLFLGECLKCALK